MARPLCPSCSFPLRTSRIYTTARLNGMASSRTRRTITSKPPQSLRQILAEPVWSVKSLLDSPATPHSSADDITPQKLHHLLRLSALPLPSTPDAEASLLNTLRAHLRFVREIQAVDTTGVEPLRALRDETTRGRRDATLSLQDLQGALSRETRFGHSQRPRRVKTGGLSAEEEKTTQAAEDWDPLKSAGRTAAGKYFLVQSRRTTAAQ